MFTKAKNIDTAFRQTRSFFIIALACVVVLAGYGIYSAFKIASQAQNKIYVLNDGKALVAIAAERGEKLPVMARDHIKTFHQNFFTLTPDDKQIQAGINQALYLADGSAKRVYDDLKESGYYTNVVSGNVSQTVKTDSIVVNMEHLPFYFRYYGKQLITRSTSIVSRSLVTEGYLRQVDQSDNNPHGFLIERWKILENKDLDIKNR
ncbi:conjugative transposon protein TraK [Taibaiella koreensis]|uniref:conjugative transposon protein TraK n=1 Tax=Taibaiella koreensis TaxID=1268548 RepID=UPI000E59CC5C|nr:conjugative transposon protein TraK [Taibaiella koreensis]